MVVVDAVGCRREEEVVKARATWKFKVGPWLCILVPQLQAVPGRSSIEEQSTEH